MKKTCLFSILVILGFVIAATACADPLSSLKVNPQGVDYPLVRNSHYPSDDSDPFTMSFGVRTWLKPLKMAQNPMFEQTEQESNNWVRRYSGYGVLGHGEDVFTSQGAQFRRQHRGR
jgi:hypothetical protein